MDSIIGNFINNKVNSKSVYKWNPFSQISYETWRPTNQQTNKILWPTFTDLDLWFIFKCFRRLDDRQGMGTGWWDKKIIISYND